MSSTTIYLIIALFVVLNGAFLWFIYSLIKKGLEKPEDKEDDKSFLLLQNQMNELNKTLDSKIGESSKLMADSVKTQFGESQKLIKDITEKMTEIKETNKQVFGMTEQLQNLEKVLKNQKQRGNLGEAGLDLILSNILPPTEYKMQYSFEDGDIVDAVIYTKDGIIPVDAKFSLDNYNRIVNEDDEDKKLILEKEFTNDLKKRIDETAKYIKIKEGTLPFAIMYIPAEAIYYDLLVNEVGSIKVNTKSLIEYAYRDRKVIIVSPTTFVAYLSTILQGFKAFKVEESAKEIIKNVEKLQGHIKAYDNYHTKLGASLSTTVNHFNTSRKELGKIDKDIYRITGGSTEIDPLLIEKPEKE
ncbi:MAG: DNA recombination protein RmuC [Candidatus Pacebacteria bacterium]|nr:DNA recombination protein RmuC [Candidatus Paceibacterota bacterium]